MGSCTNANAQLLQGVAFLLPEKTSMWIVLVAMAGTISIFLVGIGRTTMHHSYRTGRRFWKCQWMCAFDLVDLVVVICIKGYPQHSKKMTLSLLKSCSLGRRPFMNSHLCHDCYWQRSTAFPEYHQAMSARHVAQLSLVFLDYVVSYTQ